MDALTYECGCRSRNGIVIERCAEAARLKAEVEAWRPDTLDAISRPDITRAATALSAHYPSKFAAPRPCGPVE